MLLLSDLDFLTPTLRPTPERDLRPIASVSATLRRIEQAKERVQSDFRDAVSGKYKYVDPYIEELESFASRLIRENTAKQAEPDKSALAIRRMNSRLADEYRLQSQFDIKRARKSIEKRFYDDVWHPSRRNEEIPRTVFNTEAWIGQRLARTTYLGRRLLGNPHFISRALALPCVERSVRREVMFARGRAGKGYRGRRRRSKFGDIWC